MKLKTITYKRVKNLGNYNSESWEATAEIEDIDRWQDEMQSLKTIVERKLSINQDDIDKLEDERNELRAEIRNFTASLDEVKEKWGEIKQVLTQAGIDPSKYENLIPF